MLCRAFLLFLLLSAGAANAEKSLEVYQLSFRQAEDIIPLIEPHLGAEASLSGQGRQLIVRAESARQREIAELIEQLDVAPRSLRIAVRSGGEASRELSGAGVGTGSVRIYRSESARTENLNQQVRALEGRPAFIAAAVSVPITDRTVVVGREQTGVQDSTRFLELRKGFYAIAHVHGDRVEIDIATEHAELDAHRGGLRRQQVITSVSGRLGEWLPVGATRQGGSRDQNGITYRSRDARGQDRSVWLKVDVLD